MALFDGVENFTPSFTGQQLAIQAGGQMASSFNSGRQIGLAKRRMGQDEAEFEYKKWQYRDQIDRLNAFSRYLNMD